MNVVIAMRVSFTVHYETGWVEIRPIFAFTNFRCDILLSCLWRCRRSNALICIPFSKCHQVWKFLLKLRQNILSGGKNVEMQGKTAQGTADAMNKSGLVFVMVQVTSSCNIHQSRLWSFSFTPLLIRQTLLSVIPKCEMGTEIRLYSWKEEGFSPSIFDVHKPQQPVLNQAR